MWSIPVAIWFSLRCPVRTMRKARTQLAMIGTITDTPIMTRRRFVDRNVRYAKTVPPKTDAMR